MFSFRLEKVLRYRERKVDEEARCLKQLQDVLRQVLGERNALNERIAALVQRDARTRHQCPDARLWQLQANYVTSLRQRLACIRQREAAAALEVESQRQKLLAAHREQVVMEKLKERRYAAWRQEQRRRERKEMDEVGSRHRSGRFAPSLQRA